MSRTSASTPAKIEGPLDPVLVLTRQPMIKTAPPIDPDRIQFIETTTRERTRTETYEIRPAVYFRHNGQDIAFASGEPLPQMGNFVALHIKILNAHQPIYRGRGIGSILAIVFAALLSSIVVGPLVKWQGGRMGLVEAT